PGLLPRELDGNPGPWTLVLGQRDVSLRAADRSNSDSGPGGLPVVGPLPDPGGDAPARRLPAVGHQRAGPLGAQPGPRTRPDLDGIQTDRADDLAGPAEVQAIGPGAGGSRRGDPGDARPGHRARPGRTDRRPEPRGEGAARPPGREDRRRAGRGGVPDLAGAG